MSEVTDMVVDGEEDVKDTKDTKPSISLPQVAFPATTATSSSPSTTKPASKVTKAKRRSPSPTPPPPVLPLQTIRIDIQLGGPDNYEVDIAGLARASGQRPLTPVRTVRRAPDSSDSSEEERPEGLKKKGKKKKAHTGAEYYDVNDPFIDDSELALDERTYFGQTKQHGFYVSSGQVALKLDPVKKVKSKRLFANLDVPIANLPVPSNQLPTGTKDEPIPLSDDNDDSNTSTRLEGEWTEEVGQKRKRYTTITENGKKRKVVDIKSFHPSLQSSLAMLKKAIENESWAEKGKFPPAIKPILAEVALEAVRLGEYDDHFFSLMPTLFPYNKFTMTKLIKRTIFTEHTRLIVERQEELLKELGELAREGLPKAEEDWKRSFASWAARQPATTSTDEPMPMPTEMELHDNDDTGTSNAPNDRPSGSGPGGNGKETKDLANNPPGKKYRLTEKMKSLVWQLVLLSNQCGAMENEKNGLEQSTLLVSEQALRKVLYQKIIAVFPPGWMTSNHLSRDVSAIKKRLEREANDDVQMQEA